MSLLPPRKKRKPNEVVKKEGRASMLTSIQGCKCKAKSGHPNLTGREGGGSNDRTHKTKKRPRNESKPSKESNEGRKRKKGKGTSGSKKDGFDGVEGTHRKKVRRYQQPWTKGMNQTKKSSKCLKTRGGKGTHGKG
jgi:hypothetical protein